MSYWARIAGGRMGRRRILGGAAVLGAGVAGGLLVGCSGSDSSKGGATPSASSGLIYTPVDTTSKAKPGGTLRSVTTIDAATLDILSTSALGTIVFAPYTYPKMVKTRATKAPNILDGSDIVGDLAESFEMSGDKLQITFKLRKGLKWDARTPTSGREIDSSDVLFSWNKFAAVSPFRTSWAYTDTNKAGAVQSVQAVDKSTVIFKLARPNSSIMPQFTSNATLFVMPKESDGGFDPKADMRGYGPFLLEEYRASQSFTFKRAQDYYETGRPYVDRLEFPLVTEYATRLSQFRAGSIYTTVASQDDIIQTKKDIPALNVTRSDDYQFFAGGAWIGFGYEGPPFKDERVRQAAFYLFDRVTFTDVFSNRKNFQNAGFDMDIRYDSNIQGPYQGFWRDPMDEKGFGPNSKFYKYNPAEAKKLLTAAGYPNGVDTQLHHITTGEYGATYPQQYQAVQGMMQEGGIRVTLVPHQYGPIDWHTNIYYGYSRTAGSGKGFTGMLYSADFPYPVFPLEMYANFHKSGERFHGMTPTGDNAFDGDPIANDACEKVQVEFDVKKQQQLAQDLDSYMSGKAYFVPAGYGLRTFGATWPIIQNLGLYSNAASAGYAGLLNNWIDDSKPPVGKS